MIRCDEISEYEPDTSQYVHLIRPPGQKCTGSDCPYNDNVYFTSGEWAGLCLNCIDDRNRGSNEHF